MAAPSYSLPTVGNNNSTEDPIVRTALSELKTLLTDGLDDGNIAAGGVGSTSLASGAVTAAKVANDAIVNANVASSAAITGDKLDTTDGRLKQTVGLVTASSNLSLTGSYSDITGATVTFTPDVACYALVTAVFDLEIDNTNAIQVATGTLTVDGSAQTRTAVLAQNTNSGSNITPRATVTQVYRVPLTAASHTLKLQAMRTASGSATCYSANTNFLYQLVAQ